MNNNILLMRHFETDWNRERRIQGQIETHVCKYNENSIIALDRLIKSKLFDLKICYSSVMLRAKQTLKYILKNKEYELFYSDKLIEQSYGPFEGRLIDSLSYDEKLFICKLENDNSFVSKDYRDIEFRNE